MQRASDGVFHTRFPVRAQMVDVGCGIGGSSRHIARKFGASAKGITLSPKQAARANEITQQAGLADRVSFQVGREGHEAVVADWHEAVVDGGMKREECKASDTVGALCVQTWSTSTNLARTHFPHSPSAAGRRRPGTALPRQQLRPGVVSGERGAHA